MCVCSSVNDEFKSINTPPVCERGLYMNTLPVPSLFHMTPDPRDLLMADLYSTVLLLFFKKVPK